MREVKKVQIMTTPEVGALLGLSCRRVQELAMSGVIPAIRPKGRRKWIFLKRVVARYMGLSEDEI